MFKVKLQVEQLEAAIHNYREHVLNFVSAVERITDPAHPGTSLDRAIDTMKRVDKLYFPQRQ